MEMSHLNYEILMLEEDLERHEFGTEMYDAIYKLIWQKIYRVEWMRMDYGNTVEHYWDGVMCQLRMRNVLGY